MSIVACSVDGCESKIKARGYCSRHYQRFKKTGSPNKTASGRMLKAYADDAICGVEECDGRPAKRNLCGKHYQRLMSHGDTSIVLHRTGCLVDGCESKHFGHGYCSNHRYRFVATGDPDVNPSGRAIRGTRVDCAVSGCDRGCRGGGGYCNLHAGNFRATGDPLETPGPKVKSRPCAQCGDVMNLTIPGNGRKRATSSRRTCIRCRRDSDLRRFVPELIERDGTACNLCDAEIDLSLAWPHPQSRSVDHVIPWSRGGEDNMSNYALTHLFCNLSKHDRMDMTA